MNMVMLLWYCSGGGNDDGDDDDDGDEDDSVALVAQSHHTKLENVPLKLASILNGTTVISRSQWREHFKSNKNWIYDNLYQNARNWNFHLVAAVILLGFYAAL